MPSEYYASAAVALAVAAMILVWLLMNKDYTLLLIWPSTIYLTGPVLSLLFVDEAVLGRYVWPEEIVATTYLILFYCIICAAFGRLFRTGRAIRSALTGTVTTRLWQSRLFLPLLICTALAAATLQLRALFEFGSVLTGSYVLDSANEGLIPYWGFLAGLYEIIFLCFLLYLLSGGEKSRRGTLCIIVYLVTTLLRIAGGTRLVLVKEIAFMLLVLYLRGSLSLRRIILLSLGVVATGSLIGILRSGSDDLPFFAPAYGLIMESALNALTLNIAYHTQASGFVASNVDYPSVIGYFILNTVPTFLRIGWEQTGLDELSPYILALAAGNDTWSPVGGMSGFATLCYLSEYPFTSVALLGLFITGTLSVWQKSVSRDLLILAFVINTIHFWRDPTELAVKLFVQALLVCLALWIYRRRSVRHAPSTLLVSAQ